MKIQGIEPELLYTVKRLLAVIPVSRSHLYRSLLRYNVPCINVGKSRVYLGLDVLDFIKKIKTGRSCEGCGEIPPKEQASKQ